ncbi:anthranilate phosphoribosyltransferase [Carboxylicivirga mesophila]|uniref:Anthranilate phosphoribosyltransferase n=1 Tax=Carboxylicivirga mesophila TaxID=1166478 RepID=A0ABS5K9C4_9BACT|nr:anthranilate phosphoribosyltransferase [Carboxylicivirga mesophila]MBS2211596.1 anthranilate phosphoribosyltransferase [Carboxylicivirga mesophila]
MSIKQTIKELINHKTLTRAQAKNVLVNIAKEQYNQSEVVAFLTVFMMRPVTVEELSGFRDALLELCLRVDLSDYRTIDMCGTGGDGKNTFNISTLASLVVAGTGAKVAKHGNYSVSSSCGSSNVMEYLGYRFTNDENKLKEQLDKANICFLHAPLFHPAMKVVAPIRKELGLKTFFNMLGPMVNPSFPAHQLVGVFSLELARVYQYIYQQTNIQYSIVHALDSYDEVSLTGDFKAITNTGELVYSPNDFSMKQIQPEEIFGGDTVPEAANIFKTILEGKGSEAQNNVVIANAALALNCYSPEKGLEQNIEEARQSLLNGQAAKVLSTLISI